MQDQLSPLDSVWRNHNCGIDCLLVVFLSQRAVCMWVCLLVLSACYWVLLGTGCRLLRRPTTEYTKCMWPHGVEIPKYSGWYCMTYGYDLATFQPENLKRLFHISPCKKIDNVVKYTLLCAVKPQNYGYNLWLELKSYTLKGFRSLRFFHFIM